VAKSYYANVELIWKAAIAVYESPQARQFAEDVRRRIALALHSLGDEINPQAQQPRFNRPEDAEGFMQSAGSAEPGVEADEESRRRELMYWNAVHMEKLEKERKLEAERPANRSRGSSFDDFLQEDHTAEKGTYVYNTGADLRGEPAEGLRNRGGVRGLDRSLIYANPFSDEHHIDLEEQRAVDASLIAPEAQFETFSDIYSANDEPQTSRPTIVRTPVPRRLKLVFLDALNEYTLITSSARLLLQTNSLIIPNPFRTHLCPYPLLK
jgi:hypothetical protein